MKRVIVVLVLCLGGFSLVPALAAADERGAFVTLDRVGTASEVGLEVSALFYTSGGPDFGLRENLHGRFVDPSGFGVFAQFSLAHAFAGGDTETAATNPEVGGLYVLKLDGVDVAFRVGVGIPVAPKTLNGLVTNAVVAIARFEDLALIGPDSLWLRPGVSLRAGARAAFAQLDLGIDVPIKTGDLGTKKVELHGNVGIGTTQGPVALTAELATLAADNDGLEFFHDLGVSLRYVDGSVRPYIAYVLPFKFGEKIPGHVITAGVTGVF